MAFDVRCPSCKAKMRFDDPPKRGDPIECPKCGQTFPAPSANAFEEKKADPPKKADDPKKGKKPKTVEAEPRTYFNHWLLLLIVGGLMGMLITVFTIVWVVVARAARAEDMVACVPDNFNVLRGVNLKAMQNYPKVKANADKFYDAEASGIYDECSKKLGLDSSDLVFYVCARQAGTNSVLHMFAVRDNFDPTPLGGGQTVPLGRAGVSAVCPTRNLIMAASGSNASTHLSLAAENARTKPRDGMHTKIGTTGKLAIRGQIWTVFRDSGTLKDWMARGVEPLKADGSLTKLRDSVSKASVLATWVSFGTSGVRVGAGIELNESKDAADLVIDLKKGPLGKADESEPPNSLKQSLSSVANVSQNGAFWQYLEYRQSGSCAYLTSKIEDPEKANNLLGEFINSGRGSGSSGGGGFGGPGGFGR